MSAHSSLLRIVFALGGVAVIASLWWGPREKILHGTNDFVAFYAGSQLAGSQDLYNRQRFTQVEIETSGATGEALQFVRPPFYAVALAPLRLFPYRSAYMVWQFLSLAAVVAFIFLWPAANRWPVVWTCCWSIPLSACFAQGQDSSFLLIWIMLVMRFHKTRPFLAGLILSLCAPKFHLFLLIPILIVLQRRWRLASGFLLGAGVMLAVSFIAGGKTWPRDYYEMIRSDVVSPNVAIMPNVHGLLAGVPHATLLEIALGALMAATAGVVAYYSSFEHAFAANLLSGLLVSRHAYPADAVVVIPALLLMLFQSQWRGLRIVSFVLLTPIACAGLLVGGTPINLLRVSLLLFACALAWQSWRTRRAAASAR